MSVHLSMPSFLPYFGDKKETDRNSYGWLAKIYSIQRASLDMYSCTTRVSVHL